MSLSADAHPAATVRDLPDATRRDVPDATIRDDAPLPSTLMQLPSTLAARYRIVQPMPAAGGEADLLLVEALADGQPYVIKIYRYGIVVKPEVLARISAAAPDQVIHLVEYGQADGHGYEVLEYVAAGSLRPWLTAGPLADGQVRALVRELSTALAVLHQHDILHRDIKPENVLIRQWEPLRIALTDFGIASVAEATQHFTTTARTLRYAAPEAATGVIGMAADYWSLGMVALEALTGRHPFAGLSEAVLSYQLVTQPVDCGGVAEPWRTLCRGLLLRDPKQRWGQAEITRWLAGDATLRLPVDAGLSDAEASRARRFYRLGGVECWTVGELAAQMAKQWEAARKDLGRGFITDWLRTELHDQDLARTALDVLDNSKMGADEQLLRVLMAMAPDLPPTYRQWSLVLEDLIAAANQANQGDEAFQEWLADVYQRDVLEIYAQAGNVEYGQIWADWQTAVKDYKKTWRKALANNPFLAKAQPDLVVVLPSLLLSASSPIFQKEVNAEFKALVEESSNSPTWFCKLLAGSLHYGGILAIKIFLSTLRSMNQLIANRYLDNGDGTVSDVETSLQWMRFSLGQTWQKETCINEPNQYTWNQAMVAAVTLNNEGGYAGYCDWRVPTKKELLTLVYSSSGLPKAWNDTGRRCEGNYESPTINQLAFPNTPAWGFWSSDRDWNLNFQNGYPNIRNESINFYVRLVRGGQPDKRNKSLRQR
ncbi:MAG: eukaryotic-like serine/threonine-protein kinase [Pseudomonadota bacterium]|nr:eukaryotic-like serine/threonine-protein kinase [Pseudomonadota bacterium]